RGQGDDPKHAWADALAVGLDGPTLAGRVAPLEDHAPTQPCVADPVLQPAQFRLQLSQFLLIFFALHATLHRIREFFGHEFLLSANRRARIRLLRTHAWAAESTGTASADGNASKGLSAAATSHGECEQVRLLHPHSRHSEEW